MRFNLLQKQSISVMLALCLILGGAVPILKYSAQEQNMLEPYWQYLSMQQNNNLGCQPLSNIASNSLTHLGWGIRQAEAGIPVTDKTAIAQIIEQIKQFTKYLKDLKEQITNLDFIKSLNELLDLVKNLKNEIKGLIKTLMSELMIGELLDAIKDFTKELKGLFDEIKNVIGQVKDLKGLISNLGKEILNELMSGELGQVLNDIKQIGNDLKGLVDGLDFGGLIDELKSIDFVKEGQTILEGARDVLRSGDWDKAIEGFSSIFSSKGLGQVVGKAISGTVKTAAAMGQFDKMGSERAGISDITENSEQYTSQVMNSWVEKVMYGSVDYSTLSSNGRSFAMSLAKSYTGTLPSSWSDSNIPASLKPAWDQLSTSDKAWIRTNLPKSK